MSVADWVFDGLVAGSLPVLAWSMVRAGSVSHAVVLFIAIGLMSSLAWARLGAIDIALAEASLGAGITGALFMTSLRKAAIVAPRRTTWAWRSPALAALMAAVASLVAYVLGCLPGDAKGLVDPVIAELDRAGVSQPVTATLLNYRGYDTFLEIAVLLCAAVIVRFLAAGRSRRSPERLTPLLVTLAGLLVPVSVLFSGYLLFKGTYGPGGAFQAGAVLAGGAVVLMLADRMRIPTLSTPLVRVALLVGPLVFIAVAAESLLFDCRLLEYPDGEAKRHIIAIETALTLSIAVVLAMFFPGEGFVEMPGGADHPGSRPP